MIKYGPVRLNFSRSVTPKLTRNFLQDHFPCLQNFLVSILNSELEVDDMKLDLKEEIRIIFVCNFFIYIDNQKSRVIDVQRVETI